MKINDIDDIFLCAYKNELYSENIKYLSYPVEIYVELTNVCNSDCIYCYKKKLNTNISFFDYNVLLKILDEIKNRHTLLILEGGEPLLHPYFEEIYTQIRDRNINVDIITNGIYLQYLTDDFYKKFKKSNDEIQISLDGLGCYNFINRKVSSVDVIKSIKLLNKKGIKPRINTVVTKYNISGIYDFLNFINNNLGISSITLNKVIGVSNYRFQAKDNQLANLMNEIERKTYDFKVFNNLNYTSYKTSCYNKGSTIHNRCTALTGKVCIATDLSLYPCVFYENISEPLGSIKNNTILDIWESSESKVFRNKKNNIFAKCKICKDNSTCSQLCIGTQI